MFKVFEAYMGSPSGSPMPLGVVNLDAMHITVDKAATVAALKDAETAFLNTAIQLRANGREDLAKLYEKQAGILAALLVQIGSNGGKVVPVN